MPYIPKDDRDAIDQGDQTDGPGELTYRIYKACMEHFNRSEKRYADRGEIILALECAKLEFYRNHLAHYEDGKRVQHGDVL